MIDLSQVSHALRGATARSLIILDEFGKGKYYLWRLNYHQGRYLRTGQGYLPELSNTFFLVPVQGPSY